MATGPKPPPYGSRKGFIPRGPEDFDGGGAFPEIHVAQYPLDMGRRGKKSSTLSLSARPSGSGKVFATSTDLVVKHMDKETLVRPSEEEEQAALDKTKAALEKLVNAKISATKPVTVPDSAVARADKAKYIRYTPSEDAPGKMKGAKQRIIRMVDMPVDPLEPPKFKHKKVPGGPPSPPVPVMHSPPRKVTVKDQQAWKIPPCVSNWKNAKGYTIPLDKRLAADGRTLMQPTINDRFATVSEALYVAERKARAEIEARREVQKSLLMRQKEQQEEKLRDLAARARSERANLAGGAAGTGASAAYSDDEGDVVGRGAAAPAARSGDGGPAGETAEEREARLQREQMRRERKRERERDMRLEALGKKTKSARDRDRDISEKIALGQAGAQKLTGDALLDKRLFNQDAGLGSGFGDDEEDRVYTKPLFTERGAR